MRSISSLKSAGYRVVTADRDPDAPGHQIADDHRVISIADPQAVMFVAGDIRADLILATTEAGVYAAATASAKLGLPGTAIDTVLSCLDKGLMRKKWSAFNLRQPAYRCVEHAHDISTAAAELGLPVVVKPRRGWGSRGVSVVLSEGDLSTAIADASAHSGEHGFIVEEFISGPLLTADGFVKDGAACVAMMGDTEFQSHSRIRVNMSLNYPAAFPPAILDKAERQIIAAVHAVGLSNSAFHCESIVCGEDVYLVEIAARGGGGHIFSTVTRTASGLDAPATLAKILLGDPIDIRPPRRSGACYRFLQAPPGRFITATGVSRAQTMPGVLDLGLSIREGENGGVIAHDNARHGWVVTEGSDRHEAVTRARAAIASVSFKMAES